MLTNEYEYNEFGTKAFYEKLKCLLTDVISYFVVFTYQDGNLVAQLVALFKFVAQMLAFVVLLHIQEMSFKTILKLISCLLVFLFALLLLKFLVEIFLQRLGWLHLGPTSANHRIQFLHFINFK